LTARNRAGGGLGLALLAVLAYVPQVLTEPGVVAADTKTYLYLDPGKLLARAVSMWDPNVGMGTLTHQTIGYLFPMGPWFWFFDTIGAPDWLAQRLWLGTILFAAGAGVLFLARTIGWRGAGPVVAALAYMLSPYVLDYSARISVILLPWAALPWLVAFADRALKRGGWRDPALFALVVLGVGGVNATALVFAGLGPVLWLVFAAKEAGARATIAAAARIGALTALVSVWWVMGLAVQGSYGIPILRYTETVETVARTSLASEVLRGLGYWFFYGNDKLGPWIEPAIAYTQTLWLMALSFAVPTLALAGAALLRWRHRAFAVALVAIGTLVAVGAHPYDRPSPIGSAFKSLANTSTVGLALRSTPRAVPLVALGLALLLGAAVTAIANLRPNLGRIAAVAAAVLVIAAMAPPLVNGDVAVGQHIKRPEKIPAYWPKMAHYLDAKSHETRVLELPGSDFASYRWGNTIDPITPYLMDRPYVARELIPYGSPASADLLNAFDRRLQEGVAEPQSLVPFAQLISAGDVLFRNDLQYERYRTPHPRVLADELGLTNPFALGPQVPSTPTRKGAPLVDELDLGVPAGARDPRAVETYPIAATPPILRAQPVAGGTIVAGDGEGIVDLAAAGLLHPEAGPIRYAGSITDWAGALADPSTALVLTDSNRLRARRWGTVRENTGFTEQPGAGSLVADPTDARLDVFPTQTTASQTIAQQRGVASVRASHYGNPVSYTPEDRAANALDGDLDTAWRVGAFAPVEGERLRVELKAPVTTDNVRAVQPQTGPRNRFITRARLTFDGKDFVDVDLGEPSRHADGEVLRFPSRTFRTLDFEILSTDAGRRPVYDGLSGVGLAELDVAGARVDEVLRLPTDLLAHAGDATRSLTVVLTRQRSNPGDPNRSDEEPSLKRTFSLPTARSFTIGGTARISPAAPDDVVDQLIGVTGVVARSDARLPGDLAARASAAVDGDPATAWSPGLGDQVGHWMEVETPAPITVDHLDLRLVDDGRHSVPTRIRLEVDDGEVRFLDLPTTTFAPVTGRRFRVVIEDTRPVVTPDFFSDAPLQLPVAIAELGLPGVRAEATPPRSPCRDDLVTVDGQPLPVRREPDGTIGPCGRSLELGPGDHDVRTAPGKAAGIDVDRLLLHSFGRADFAMANSARPNVVTVTGTSRTSFDASVQAAKGEAFWLVLGQSHNAGWKATAGGHDLGPPELVDGYANGWLVRPTATGHLDVHLEWTPQRKVRIGLAVSAVATLACLVLALRRRPLLSSLPHVADNPAMEAPGAPTYLAALVVTAVFLAAAGLAVGVLAGAATLAAARWKPARWGLAFGAALALAAAAAYTVGQQARYGYPPDFAWPVNVERAHGLGWLAVALLTASAMPKRRLKSR
jgi:arabinofuranan 3-O-arabinosyltransferase